MRKADDSARTVRCGALVAVAAVLALLVASCARTRTPTDARATPAAPSAEPAGRVDRVEKPAADGWPMYRHDAQHTGCTSVDGPTAPWVRVVGDTGSCACELISDGVARAYVSTWTPAVLAFDLGEGVLWERRLAGTSDYPPVASVGGYLVAPSHGGEVVALEWDGSTRWRVDLGCPFVSGAVAGPNGSVYLCTGAPEAGYTIQALGPRGQRLWAYRADRPTLYPPTLDHEGRVLVTAADSSGAALLCLSESGDLLWEWPTASQLVASVAVGPCGEAYALGRDGSLTAVGPQGTALWTVQVGPQPFAAPCPAVGGDGTVYVGSAELGLSAVKSDGTVAWRVLRALGVLAPACVDGTGTVYVSPRDGSVCAVTSDGRVLWSRRVGSIEATGPVIAAPGVIAMVSPPHLYVLEDPPLQGVPALAMAHGAKTGAELRGEPED